MDHKQYLASIGRKGGKKRSEHAHKAKLARIAAYASWLPEARAKRLSMKRAKASNMTKK